MTERRGRERRTSGPRKGKPLDKVDKERFNCRRSNGSKNRLDYLEMEIRIPKKIRCLSSSGRLQQNSKKQQVIL